MRLSKELRHRLEEDRVKFQETIGGKEWTTEDTIWEFIKMADAK